MGGHVRASDPAPGQQQASSPGPLQALPDAAAPQMPGNGVALMTALLPSHVALGPVLHPSFQINYHFSLKILLKLLELVS